MGAAAYYNEIDPYAAQWLRNLISAGHIAPGDVDERSIVDVRPDDLTGYAQCHFFAGIGGWSYAARLAGWPDGRPLWTGSCPCQPFSSAARGKGGGFASAKHLWPVWLELVRAVRPAVVFGEQVASAEAWADQVGSDLEGEGYTFWPVHIPAGGAGADHIRPRLWFLSHADSDGQSGRPEHAEASRMSWSRGEPGGVGAAHGVSARVAQLRAFGNAIVPQVAAEVIAAFLESERLAAWSPPPNPTSKEE